MATDVKLGDEQIVLEGVKDSAASSVVASVNDLEVRATETVRWNGKPIGGLRRALVHAWDDKLVVNWLGDYTGGTELQGKVLIAVPNGYNLVSADPGGSYQVVADPAKTIDLLNEINSLRQDIAMLKSAVVFDILPAIKK